MNEVMFARLVEEFLEREQRIFAVKKQDYVGLDGDRLRNFKEIAALVGDSPVRICLILLLKHIQSIVRAICEGEYLWVWEENGREGLKQRIADARNYLLLLAACIEEQGAGTCGQD